MPSQHVTPNASTQALPATTLPARHVTFEFDLGISSTPTRSHYSLPSEQSQSPSFATPPPPSDLSTDLGSQSGAETDDLDLMSSGTDPGPVQRRHSKHKSRAAPSPRAQRHIKHIRRAGPAGNKRRGKALDVWSFFLPEEGENVCALCKYVVTLPSLHVNLIGSSENFAPPTTTTVLPASVYGQQLGRFALIYFFTIVTTGLRHAMSWVSKSSHQQSKVP